MPGIHSTEPARRKARVSATPASSGTEKLTVKRRAGPFHAGPPALVALATMNADAIPMASAASRNQTAHQAPNVACRDAPQAAPRAVAPTTTVPHPGTAVKAAERSIVSRI